MGGRLTDLGAEVSASLDRARVANGAAERVRARLAAGEPPRARASRIRWEVLAGAVAAAAAVVLGIALGRQPAPRTEALTFHVAQAERGVVGAFLAAPAEREMPLAFSDGTNIRLAPLAKARVSEVGPNGARVLLESGVVHAEVVHRPDAHWSVDAGPFEVRVTGTKFDVAWDPSEASIVVELREGSVVVTGCTLGEGRRVVAGEKLHVSCMHSAAVSAAPPTLTPQALPDATATATPTPTPTSTSTPSETSTAGVSVAETASTSARPLPTMRHTGVAAPPLAS
ncbi:MAG TPA: FecR family protein [Labilithrix sp.]